MYGQQNIKNSKWRYILYFNKSKSNDTGDDEIIAWYQ